MHDDEGRAMTRGVSPGAPPIDASVPIGGLLLGLPCYGGVLYDGLLQGVISLQRLCNDHSIPLGYITIRNESLVQRARNRCIAEFLANPKATHLMFVDADIGFTGESVFRLIAHDKPIIGGLYRRKQLDRAEYVWNRLPPDQEKRNPRTGAVSCAAIGTGFMLIQRQAIERMIEASLLPDDGSGVRRSPLRYLTAPTDGDPGDWRNHTFSLFDCWIDETGNYLSEDYAFCRRWRDLGGEIWADPAIRLEHIGAATFSGDPMEVL